MQFCLFFEFKHKWITKLECGVNSLYDDRDGDDAYNAFEGNCPAV